MHFHMHSIDYLNQGVSLKDPQGGYIQKNNNNTRFVLSEKMRSKFCCSFLGLLVHSQACPVLE